MKKIVRLSLTLALAAVLTTGLFANGLNLNGFGARSAAMGGAFVGLADDFSAVFWNPAGAAGFRQTTYGFYATDLVPSATFKMSIRPDVVYVPEFPPPTVDGKTKKAHYLGFLGSYYKPIGSKVVVGLGIGQLVALVSPLPASIPVATTFIGFLFCTLVGLIFGVYPAVRASKLDPIEALRYE